MNYNKEIPRKTIRQPGVVCRHCEIPFSATSVLSDDGNFACRILYCEQCKTIVDKNWWSMPKMMAKTHPIKSAEEATEDWEATCLTPQKKPTLREAVDNIYTTRFEEERSLVNQKFHGRKESENTDLHEEEEAELVKEKHVCHCSLCGGPGHNRRTCPSPLEGCSVPNLTAADVEHDTSQAVVVEDPPGVCSLQSCSVCGAQGHNKRTCKVGVLILQPKND